MGNSITRRGRRRRSNQVQHTERSQTQPDMETNESSGGSDTESPNADVEPNLASILSFLLRSGQVRLVRSGGLGAFEVSVGASGRMLGDSSDEEDHEYHPRKPVSPRGDYVPDLSNLNNSEIKSIIMNESGFYHEKPQNITSRLLQRESHSLHKRDHFTKADRTICSEHYIPNSYETVARYRSKVFCGTYSSDGNVFMSACQDQHIRLYDTTGGNFKQFRDITARDVGWSIVDTAYSPDQNYIIYSSWSDFIHQCNLYGDHDTHLALDLRPRERRFCAFSVSFSHDSKEIIAGASDRCLYIYDREKDDRVLRIVAHDDDVNAVTFSGSSSNILVSGGDDGICKVWDRRELREENPKPVGMFAGHTEGITYVCAKGDENHFISNSKDQSIKLWDTRRFSSEENVKQARRIVAKSNWDYRWETVPRRSARLQNVPGNDSVMTYRGHRVLHTLLRAKFSPIHTTGQRYIYAGCATGNIVIYDILTGEIVKKLRDGHRQCVRDISWHPYENTIVSAAWDSTICKWDYYRLACEESQCDAPGHNNSEDTEEKDSKRRKLRNNDDRWL